MYDTVYWFFGGAGVVALLVWVAARLWRRADSGDTERYLRQRAQGPFVPLSDADLADDARRKAGTR